jgi:hypothetical protein
MKLAARHTVETATNFMINEEGWEGEKGCGPEWAAAGGRLWARQAAGSANCKRRALSEMPG